MFLESSSIWSTKKWCDWAVSLLHHFFLHLLRFPNVIADPFVMVTDNDTDILYLRYIADPQKILVK